jgi:SAM-dependent methyltransferase
VVERSLAGHQIHDEWEARYRTPENLRFGELAIDRLVQIVGAEPGATFLDAGCGTGFNVVRLARRGFRVQGIDFAPPVLAQARANVARAEVEDRVLLSQANLLALPLEDRSFRYVLCWGVLMHIPEVERAIAELARVVAPGGRLIVGEGNMHSPDELALRLLDWLGRTTSRRRTAAGSERWRDTPAGPLFVRRSDVRWLIGAFEAQGLTLRAKLPCQFTEAYVYTRSGTVLSRLVHGFDNAWFRAIRTPALASDVFLVFERPAVYPLSGALQPV